MPSAKPDKNLIKTAVRERYGWNYPRDIFTTIQDAAIMAIADGAITPSKAAQLASILLAYPRYDFFPYKTLQAALDNALQPAGWTPTAERDLLVFLTYVFGGDDIRFEYPKLLNEDLPTIGSIYPQLFDTPPQNLALEGKLCDFTGAFEGKSRKQCYEQIIQRGGTPSDGGWYTDCFFVADAHYCQQAISNGLASAIKNRTLFGITRIYRESAFK